MPNQYQPMHPPVPYQQFEYSFPPAFPTDLPPPPPEPSAPSDLFSASEHTNLLGFLDQFEWQFDPLLPSGMPVFNPANATTTSETTGHAQSPRTLYSNQRPSSSASVDGGEFHYIDEHHSPIRANSQVSGPVYMSGPPSSAANSFSVPSSNPSYPSQPHNPPHSSQYGHALLASQKPKLEPPDDGNGVLKLPDEAQAQGGGYPGGFSGSADVNPSNDDGSVPILIGGSNLDDDGGALGGGGNLAGGRPQKPVLTTPEKRVRHILSEQRRRNTIRDGYTTLTTMLAPHPSAAARPAPSKSGRGARPKGARGRTRGKGKSGVLFRAVEYVEWLEHSVEDLTAEIMKLEAATQGRQWPSR